MKYKQLYFLLFLTSFILTTSCIKWVEPPTEGLVVYYSFDGNLLDRTLNHNNGIDSTSGNYVKGRWSKALDFNGYSDYVQLSNTLNGADGLSFSFWIKPRGAYGTENNGAIVSKYSMAGHFRCFMIYSFGAYETRNDNRLSGAFYTRSSTAATNDHVKSYYKNDELSIFPDPALWTVIKPRRLELKKWTHCVINVTPVEIQAYIDGDLCVKKKREYSEYYDNPFLPTYIGNNLSGGEGSNNHFNGALDELRIYNRELTKEEIRVLYNNK